jgi:general stress protein CsbA
VSAFFLLCAIIIAVLWLIISFKRKIVMRGAFIIGLAVVLLIIGILVMKNMGVDNSSGVTGTQAENYTERAKNAADEATERIKDIREQASRSE